MGRLCSLEDLVAAGGVTGVWTVDGFDGSSIEIPVSNRLCNLLQY